MDDIKHKLKNYLFNRDHINFCDAFDLMYNLDNIKKIKISNIYNRSNLNKKSPKYKDFLAIQNWEDLSKQKQLSYDFIREFQDKLNWKEISIKPNLSEDFIREFQHKVDWIKITLCQKLSENFIREFQYKVDWTIIYYNCEIYSNSFKEEFDLP